MHPDESIELDWDSDELAFPPSLVLRNADLCHREREDVRQRCVWRLRCLQLVDGNLEGGAASRRLSLRKSQYSLSVGSVISEGKFSDVHGCVATTSTKSKTSTMVPTKRYCVFKTFKTARMRLAAKSKFHKMLVSTANMRFKVKEQLGD